MITLMTENPEKLDLLRHQPNIHQPKLQKQESIEVSLWWKWTRYHEKPSAPPWPLLRVKFL